MNLNLLMDDVQQYREHQIRGLTDEKGIYALCDLDEIPIYSGCSIDGIRTRVRRHLTSARSDIIANRTIDVREVAFVWGWPMGDKSNIDLKAVEATLFHQFDSQSRLMNGEVPKLPNKPPVIPDKIRLQVLSDDKIAWRKEPLRRFRRQKYHIGLLLDYIAEIQDKKHLRRALHAHSEREQRYYKVFQGDLIEEFSP